MVANTDKTLTAIAKEFDVSQSIITRINQGKRWGFVGNYTYPLRKNAKEKSMQGEKNPSAKLTQPEVKEIRELLATTDLSQTKIAELFDVSRYPIRAINSGKLWESNQINYPIR